MTIESMLNDILGLLVVVAVVIFLVFLICLSTMIYMAEDRKILIKKYEEKEREFNILKDEFYECTALGYSLQTKVDLYEKYISLERDVDDYE